MKRNQVYFTCDTCGEQAMVEGKSERQEFPYKDGWVFLYQMDIKTKSNLSFPLRDKHFCSVECLLKFVKFKLKKGDGKDE